MNRYLGIAIFVLIAALAAAGWFLTAPEVRAQALLTLADFDDAGLDVEMAVLLQAPATISNDLLFARGSFGTVGTVLDGAPGGNIPILSDPAHPDDPTPSNGDLARMRLRTVGGGTRLQLNDNNATNTGIHLTDYFATGAGNDLTIYIQTLDDGVGTIIVADSDPDGGTNGANFDVTTTFEDVFNAIGGGERFIFALARPSSELTLSATANPQTVDGLDVVALDGTASGTGSDTLTYSWTANPDVGSFSATDIASPTWTAPAKTDSVQSVTLTLTGTDASDNSLTADVTVTVRANQGPTASATSGLTAVDGLGTVTLDGTASDPDLDTLTYSWAASPDVGSFTDAGALDTDWTAPAKTNAQQTVDLTLTVNDGLATAEDVLQIFVNANRSPTASVSPTTPTVASGDVLELDGSASEDPDGDSLTYAWTQSGAAGTFSATDIASPTWTAPVISGANQTATLTLTVSDGLSLTATASVAVTVQANAPPTASASANPQTVDGLGAVILDGTASDPDQDTLTYSWTANPDVGSFADAGALDTDWTAPAKTNAQQTVDLTLEVSDTAGNTVTAQVTVTVRANQPPTVSIEAGTTPVQGGQQVALTGTARDPDGDDLTYSWSQSGDLGTFSATDTASPTWTAPAKTNAQQTASLTLTVNDGLATATASASVVVEANRSPAFAASAVTLSILTGQGEGTPVATPVQATDPDGDAVTYSLGGTDGGDFEVEEDGQLTVGAGVYLDESVKDSYALTLTATDVDGATASVTVTVQVVAKAEGLEPHHDPPVPTSLRGFICIGNLPGCPDIFVFLLPSILAGYMAFQSQRKNLKRVEVLGAAWVVCFLLLAIGLQLPTLRIIAYFVASVAVGLVYMGIRR